MSYDKYTFRIRTKVGTIIDQVTIGANGRTEAEGRLVRMYNGCQVLECSARDAPDNPSKSQFVHNELPTYEQLLGKLLG